MFVIFSTFLFAYVEISTYLCSIKTNRNKDNACFIANIRKFLRKAGFWWGSLTYEKIKAKRFGATAERKGTDPLRQALPDTSLQGRNLGA